MLYVLAFAIGVVAGLRSLTAPAVVSWAAHVGRVPLENSGLAFLGSSVAAYVFGLCAIGELISDKLPKTPSRKAPLGFTARILTGALCGAALGAPSNALFPGLVAGAVGAVVGTLGGYQCRTWLANGLKSDLPAALLEDVVAIGGALLIVTRF
jgi:uncharacterized membrane protein